MTYLLYNIILTEVIIMLSIPIYVPRTAVSVESRLLCTQLLCCCCCIAFLHATSRLPQNPCVHSRARMRVGDSCSDSCAWCMREGGHPLRIAVGAVLCGGWRTRCDSPGLGISVLLTGAGMGTPCQYESSLVIVHHHYSS